MENDILKDADFDLQKGKHSLERIYPKQINRTKSSDRESLAIHLQRYRFATGQLHGTYILDIACGCGYGTALMAARFPEKQFIGIDVDPEAVAYASEHYKASNLQYHIGNAMTFSTETIDILKGRGGVDTIISLETIEHVVDPKGMVKNLLGQLSAAGVMIASVPTTPTVDGNPHHLHDFTIKSFYRLFLPYGFTPVAQYKQIQPWKLKGIFSKNKSQENRSQGVGRNVIEHYQKHPSALLSRVTSILMNGLNNHYLTAKFIKNQTH